MSVSDGFLLVSLEKVYVCVSVYIVFFYMLGTWLSVGGLPRSSDQILLSPERRLLQSGWVGLVQVSEREGKKD